MEAEVYKVNIGKEYVYGSSRFKIIDVIDLPNHIYEGCTLN